MTEEHRRHLTTSVRYISQLLSEAQRHAQDAALRDALDAVRDELSGFAQRHGLAVRMPEIDPAHAIRVQLSIASISVVEMRSRALRGYGALDEREARDLDASCDVLESAIDRAQHALDGA